MLHNPTVFGPNTGTIAVIRNEDDVICLVTMYPNPLHMKALMPEPLPSAKDISHLLVYFNANAYSPDLLAEDMGRMSSQLRLDTRNKFQILLSENLLTARDYYKATACSARDEASAQAFFHAVYAHIYNGGELPDIDNY